MFGRGLVARLPVGRAFNRTVGSQLMRGQQFPVMQNSFALISTRGFATKKDASAEAPKQAASKMQKAKTAPVSQRTCHRERVVIIGTGWGGTLLMKRLDPSKYAVNIVSPRNHFLFTPMLPGASVGTVSYQSICEPIRPLAMKKKARYYEAEATKVDVDKQKVYCETSEGQTFGLAYDKLVVACGYQANTFGTPGVVEHALFMKETGDAIKMRQHMLHMFERASYEHMLDDDPTISPDEMDHMKKMLTFAIVGGGPTGVEFAAELTDFITKDAMKHYPHLKGIPEVHIISGDLLPMMDQSIQKYAQRTLEKTAGVKFHLGAQVCEVGKDFVKIKDGPTIPCGIVVWCAGVQAIPFARNVALPKAANGVQILTEQNLKVKDLPNVFAIGDCATIDGNRLPQTAQVAKQQANWLAKHLNEGTDPGFWGEFKFYSLGVMAYIGGGKAAIFHENKAWYKVREMCPEKWMERFGGIIAFIGWRSVYWSMQLSIRNRYLILNEWLRTAIFGRDLTRHNKPSKPQ